MRGIPERQGGINQLDSRVSPFALRLVLVSMCITLLGCVMEEQPKPLQALNTTAEAITKSPWKLVSYKKRKTTSEPWTEFASDTTAAYNGNIATCYLDDVYTFKADGEVARDNGLNSCLSGEITVDSGSWKLNETSKKITLTFFGIPITWTIAEVTAEKLQLETLAPGEFHQAIFSH